MSLFLPKLRLQYKDSKSKLELDLKFLKQRIERALEDVEADKPLDEHLIQNAMGITHTIVHYNVALDFIPYLEDHEKDAK
jgi:hypothetical protein